MAAEPDKVKGFKDFQGAFKATAVLPPKPKTLLEMYMGTDVRRLQQDALARGEHYTERQHEVLAALAGQTTLARPATEAEQNELLITFTRGTEQDKTLKDRNRRLSSRSDDHEIILESGRSLADEAADERGGGTFENQSYGDKILI